MLSPLSSTLSPLHMAWHWKCRLYFSWQILWGFSSPSLIFFSKFLFCLSHNLIFWGPFPEFALLIIHRYLIILEICIYLPLIILYLPNAEISVLKLKVNHKILMFCRLGIGLRFFFCLGKSSHLFLILQFSRLSNVDCGCLKKNSVFF